MVWGTDGGRAARAKGGTVTTTRKKLSQWLLMRRSMSSNSGHSPSSSNRIEGRRRRVEEVVPIACTTKRTESVLQENYLFPIELDEGVGAGGAGEQPLSMNAKGEGGVVGLLKRPRRSVFSALTKTKIGPMDSGLLRKDEKGVGGNGQQMNNNNNNNYNYTGTTTTNHTTNTSASCVYSGDQRLLLERKKHSEDESTTLESRRGDALELTCKDFEMVPTIDPAKDTAVDGGQQTVTGSSVEGGDQQQPVKSAVEVEALRLLNNWGISQAMLGQAIGSGARSELMGIYRIVVHRLQMQKERQANALNTKEDEGKRGKAKTKKTTTLTNNQKDSDDGGGGGCGGKCSGTSSNCVIL